METIVNIKVANIYPHPDNPRKDVGDVTELAESIKKSGIMQNLTVIPLSALSEEPDKQPEADSISLSSDFHVLIGHRRLAAAKMAGLSEVPCKIVSKITLKEQVGIMLEENMQRADLTIWEQAQGFQMMLDLGETEDSIAEKTGFSKTTVRHRLNIAKLNQDELKKKEQSDSFQLSLKDLYALEQVEDIETRNKILREAYDSKQLVWKAQQARKDADRDKNCKVIVKLCEEKGFKPAPKNAENELWSGKWDTLKEIDLDKEVPKDIRVKAKKEDVLYYVRHYSEVRIIRKAEKKKEVSELELARKEQEKKNKEIKAKIKAMGKRRKYFIENIITGKIEKIKDEAAVQIEVWDALVLIGTSIYQSNMRRVFTDKSDYECTQEELDNANDKINKCSFLQQMLIILEYAMDNNIGDIVGYRGEFNESIAAKYKKAYAILEKYGWTFEDDEEQLLDGTHELYAK